MRRLAAIAALLAACGGKDKGVPVPFEVASAKGARFSLTDVAPPASYDPFALARASAGHEPVNEEPSTPPQCYTKAAGVSNACASCHTKSAAPNFADDWELQQNYSFTEYARTNRWQNQFRERSDMVAAFSDADVLGYVRRDNYAPLLAWLQANPGAPGYLPDLDFAKGFDAEGFAADGSQWRALRYKPFVGSFWATNGSTDDVFVRLPERFRTSREIYRTNLAILEAAITAAPRDARPVRQIEPIDERAGGLDLDGDGQLGTATSIVGIPAHYVGGAEAIAVTRALYPAGTELLHTVRYLDPERPGFTATRMKEVRYAVKGRELVERQIGRAYMDLENPDVAPHTGNALVGLTNNFGWQLHGFIEDANGWLRKQTEEEHGYCMGCHTGLGVTVDQTFAFARKVPGAAGWRPQDPTGIPDVPQAGQTTGEYAQYLTRVQGGDDLRANDEVVTKFLRAGEVEATAGAALAADIGTLVTPSARRAIALDRAYLANVIEQSYVWGREASTSPAKAVMTTITEDTRSTGLGEADRVYRDTRLQLTWPKP